MKVLAAGLLAAAWLWAAEARAQEAAQEAVSERPAGAQSDVVVVEGLRRDRAMNAFLNGDYAAAEVAFEDNIQCMRRVEVLWTLRVGSAIWGPANTEPGASSPLADSNALQSSADDLARRGSERTCRSEEWQHYMIGLSRIQLGRYAEAKQSFYRVIDLSNDQFLYDARYRIGLLELLDGDIERAERQLDSLRHLQRICQSRGARCQVRDQLANNVVSLAVAIAEARLSAASALSN